MSPTLRRARRLPAALTGAALATAVFTADPQERSAPPRLLVVVVVDQMRADYLTRHAHEWQHGLRRLLDEGAVFDRAAYPYANTVTCPGHATVATGAFPRTHGITGNSWWDRDRGALVDCSVDSSPAGAHLSYGAPVRSGNGPHLLNAPTIGDELRRQRPGARVVALSLKPDTSIMLAGQAGDIVVWFDGAAGAFLTSRAYAERPHPALADFLVAYPLEREFAGFWTLARPAATYRNADASPGQRPPPGRDGLFPHAIGGPTGPDQRSAGLWMQSPASDRYIGAMAAAIVERLGLGADATPDLLAIGFAALDLVGHAFGPDSREVEDVLIQLDSTLGTLLDALDRLVGRSNYVLALTADHGVAPIPQPPGSGRVFGEDLEERVHEVLEARWGAAPPGTYVVVRGPYAYFAPGRLAAARGDRPLWNQVLRTLTEAPGVLRAMAAEDLTPDSPDPLVRAAALSYVARRSGDIVIVTQPGWVAGGRNGTAATSHGTPHDYDQRVPLVLFGGGVRPVRSPAAATPADIAPTLAFLAGIGLPRAEGRILRGPID